MSEENRSTTIITYLILFLNFGIFLYMISSGTNFLQLIKEYGLTPIDFLRRFDLLNLVSYMLLHGDLPHLLVNSFALWGTGTIVEKELGSPYFLLLYIASGIASALGHIIINPISETPLVGASGAIFGILAILFLLMPYKFTMLLIIPLPSVIVGILVIAMEISAFLYNKDPYIAHDAHITGFIFGLFSSFLIDFKKALEGLLLAGGITILLFLIGFYYQLF